MACSAGLVAWKAKQALVIAATRGFNIMAARNSQLMLAQVTSGKHLVVQLGKMAAAAALSTGHFGGLAAMLSRNQAAIMMASKGFAGFLGVATIVGFAVAGMARSYDRGRQKAKDFAKQQDALVESTNDLAGHLEKIENLEEQREDILDKAYDISAWEAFSDGLSYMLGQGSNIGEARAQVQGLNEELEDTEYRTTMIENNSRDLAEKFGMSADEMQRLADNADIDLGSINYRLDSEALKNEMASIDHLRAELGERPSSDDEYWMGQSNEAAKVWDRQNEAINRQSAAIRRRQRAADELEGAMSREVKLMLNGTTNARALGDALVKTGTGTNALTEETVELSETSKMLQKSLEDMADPARIWGDMLEDKTRRIKEMGQAAVDNGIITKEAFRDMQEDVELNLTEYTEGLERSNVETLEWQGDLATIAEKVGKDVSEYLAEMGVDGAGIVEELANASTEDAERMAEALRLNAELSGSNAATELEAGLAIAAQKGAEGANKTVTGIADELEWMDSEVARIASKFGIHLAGGLNPILDAAGMEQIDTAAIRRTDASRTNRERAQNDRAYAQGGIEDHSPQIARAGAMRVWAEPETGGEAYIPLAQSKRARSENILAQVAAKFGMGLHHYAVGGLWEKGDIGPAPDPVGGGAFKHASSQYFEGAHKKAEKIVNDFWAMMSSGGGGAGGGGDPGGLNPRFLMMYNAYNNALGNKFRIISGYRSYASQARLYARYKAGVPGQAPAAPPGRSNHNRGLAIDHSPHSTGRDRAVAGGFGLKYPMSYEPWHVEPFWAANGGIFDSGGTLKPGMNAVYNATGKPEKLVREGAGGGHNTFTLMVDMRGAQVNGIEDFDAKIEEAGRDLVGQLSATLRKA